ncbi:Hypothetical predicted protein [Cloeon dipterum]|uniref:Uncharacterized protein n=1 Tax=Cloeon dipterum TaxID=197152 RepID=A0A8S1CW31_9INSE|nr:Hypothetical predicted protein [Cloeon dipterum]
MKELNMKGPADIADLLDKQSDLSETSKCFVKCIAEKMEIFSDNALVESKVLEWIEESKNKNETVAEVEWKIYETCKGISETNECETAAKMLRCGMKVAAENGLH